jgi:hypothetical protein
LIIKSLRGEISKAEFIKRAVELAKHKRWIYVCVSGDWRINQ